MGVVIGTKAETIKMASVIEELDRQRVPFKLIHTGQHDISSTCIEFGIRKPDIVVSEPPIKSSKFMGSKLKAIRWFMWSVLRLRSLLKLYEIDEVFCHGDTISTLLGAIAAKTAGCKLYHVEAGLRSKDWFEPFPEEIIRKIVDFISNILFVPDNIAAKNIDYKNIGSMKGDIFDRTFETKYYIVGNTVVDAVLKHFKKDDSVSPYVVVNLHRHENISSKQRMKEFVEMLEGIDLPIIFPMHDNTRKQLEKFGLYGKLVSAKIVKLKSYSEFINLLGNACLVISDGGSIQEEATTLRVPCILFRRTTERKIEVPFIKLWDGSFNVGPVPDYFINPYGSGNTGKKIVEIYMRIKNVI